MQSVGAARSGDLARPKIAGPIGFEAHGGASPLAAHVSATMARRSSVVSTTPVGIAIAASPVSRFARSSRPAKNAACIGVDVAVAA